MKKHVVEGVQQASAHVHWATGGATDCVRHASSMAERGLHTGHQALHTCTSWYASAVMFGSSKGPMQINSIC